MGTPVKVYGPAISTAVARVLVCLLEKQVKYDLISVNMSKGEHRSPHFLKIQPFGQVPAFEDDDITLFESRAICRYISEKHANQGNIKLYGTNPLEKASIEQWLEAESQSFNPPTSTLVFQLAFAPRMKIKQDEALIKQSKAKLAKVLDVYENWLGDSRYLTGDDFSLADLSHLPNSQYLMNDSEVEELFMSRGNVGRWWGEISNRESWKTVVEMQGTP
ncbi:hypothetical protein RND81_02G064000 [Saponaria officinalis]|uniref:glutathione transferase n=1 Tax=Saponaria officinalis TaxID=3572 RepID=A0AAW1MUD3_SAPOF